MDNLSGLYAPASQPIALLRQHWLSNIMHQAMSPSHDSLIRLARALPQGNARFLDDRGVPFTIMPHLNGEMGTKVTYAISDVKIGAPNFEIDAKRETLGTPVQFGHGTVEIFYLDDAGMTVGTGAAVQQDNLRRIDAAQRMNAEWHRQLLDEIIRIPFYGRRGTGGGFQCFPEPEIGSGVLGKAGSTVEQPEAVKAFWRGENVLRGPEDRNIIYAGGTHDDENDLNGSAYLTAKDISNAGAAISTRTSARNEFAMPRIRPPQGMEGIKTFGNCQIDYLLFIGPEAAQNLKLDDTGDGFTYGGFHKQVAASGQPSASMFFSNWMGNVNNIGIIVEPTKWPVHKTTSDQNVQYGVISGADTVRVAAGVQPWEDLSKQARDHGFQPMSAGMNKFGAMWQTKTSTPNEGMSQKFFCHAFLGTKQNILVHPKTREEMHHGWFAIAYNVNSVRTDGEF